MRSTYCLNLTEEEKKKIDENARKSRINSMLRIMILVSALSGATLVGAAPLPGADGFPPPAPPVMARRNPN